MNFPEGHQFEGKNLPLKEISSLFVPGLEESTRVEQVLDVLCLGRDGGGFDGPQE